MMYAILLGVMLQSPPVKEQAKPKAAEVPAAGKATASGSIVLNERHFSGRVDVKSETLDEQIQRAMANHPDLRIAQLQVELTQAKLEQERQRVTQRITAARAAVEVKRAVLAAAEVEKDNATKLMKNNATSKTELSLVEAKVAAARGGLAEAEAELSAAVGLAATTYRFQLLDPSNEYQFRAESGGPLQAKGFTLARLGQASPPAPGDQSNSYPNDFPAMLDRRVTLEKKTGTPLQVLTGLMTQAAGDKPVPHIRTSDRLNTNALTPTIMLVGDTDEVGSWLQQYLDALNLSGLAQDIGGVGVPQPPPGRFNIYVRNYGLLVALESEAPADATTVTDYWKAQRANRNAAELREQNARIRARMTQLQSLGEGAVKLFAPKADEQKAAEPAPPPTPKR